MREYHNEELLTVLNDRLDATRGDHRDRDFWAPDRCACPRLAAQVGWAARNTGGAPFCEGEGDDEEDGLAELRAADAERDRAFWARPEAEIEADLRADDEARDRWGL